MTREELDQRLKMRPRPTIEVEEWGVPYYPKEYFGCVPNYPKPIDTNPFNLIEGNENKIY